jgi:hypothetical protein
MSAQTFAPALLDPEIAAPPGLVGPDDHPAGRRFDVYRNNVMVSLIDALATGFPVIQRLVGEKFLRAMADGFARAHPPVSPVMQSYGAAFPAFLDDFPPVAHLPYLGDVARLELGLRAAYHAADAKPLNPTALQVPDLELAIATFAPAVRLVRSPYPIHAIWRANTEPGAPAAQGGAETVLITRPEFDPVATPIPAPAAEFVAALIEGARFGVALERAGDDLDLAAILTLLLTGGALTGLET